MSVICLLVRKVRFENLVMKVEVAVEAKIGELVEALMI